MKMMMSSTEIFEEVSIEELIGLNNSEIVVYNDDVNTFDHVIETLVRICDHHPHQAEQCAMIIHHNGKCTVKTGTLKELRPKCIGLLDAGLSAEIV